MPISRRGPGAIALSRTVDKLFPIRPAERNCKWNIVGPSGADTRTIKLLILRVSAINSLHQEFSHEPEFRGGIATVTQAR